MGATTELSKAIDFLGILREWDENMPFQQPQSLLLIAIYPGISMSEIADRLNLAQSSTSRNIAALGKIHRLKKEGLDFVETIEDPTERRRKICFLTPKGRREVVRLMRIFYPDFSLEAPTAREYLNNVLSSLRKR